MFSQIGGNEGFPVGRYRSLLRGETRRGNEWRREK